MQQGNDSESTRTTAGAGPQTASAVVRVAYGAWRSFAHRLMPYIERTSEYRKKKHVHSLLCLLFSLFLFLFFWRYEADVVRFTLFKLTGNEPHASSLALSFLLTGVLACLHRLVSLFVYFRDRHYVLTFVPSAVCAVLLTSLVPRPDLMTVALCGLVLVGWGSIAAIDWRGRNTDRDRLHYRIVPRLTWHAAWLCTLLLFVGIFGNGHRRYHAQLRMAELLRTGDYHAALREATFCGTPSRVVTAMRAYALSRSGHSVADGLFELPLDRADHRYLFITEADAAYLPVTPARLYDHLGVYPQPGEADDHFLSRLLSYRPFAVSTSARDYYFCALLLDRRLDDFVRTYRSFQSPTAGTSLPRAYAEAFVLHAAAHPDDSLHIRIPHLEQNYHDFQERRASHTSPAEQRNVLRSLYGGTYWWYYFYGSRKSS